MLRFRWFPPEANPPLTTVHWSVPALISATLFLNIGFWMQDAFELWQPWPFPLNALSLGAVALFHASMFFMGPALATYSAGQPLMDVIRNAFGSIPAAALRLCCALYLILWIAWLMTIPMWWAQFILRKSVSPVQSGYLAAAILAFLLVTGLQSLNTEARLAMFTNKLGIAILIAALIRVHDGWPRIFSDWAVTGDPSRHWTFRGLSELSFYVAPLALLAADFGYRCADRRHVAMAGAMGIALPLFVCVLLVGMICAATAASRFYQPSLAPNVPMALWSKTASSALPPRMMITVITLFGAVRFGVSALVKTVSNRPFVTAWGWLWLGCLVPAIVWTSMHASDQAFITVFDCAARPLVAVSAVLTCDLLVRKRRPEQSVRIDWIAASSVLAALATPLWVPNGPLDAVPEPWSFPWLLPSYLVAFVVCVSGRLGHALLRSAFTLV